MRSHSVDVFLDVGAHRGLTIDRVLEDNALRVHAFEPTPAACTALLDRFAQHPLVTIHNLALSDVDGEAEFFCNENAQTNSLLDNDIGNASILAGYTRHVDRVSVRTLTLDRWAEEHLTHGETVFVKCDVQGAEGLVIRGGRNVFLNRVVGIYAEAQLAPMYADQTDFFELHRMLSTEFGFVLANIYPCYRDASGRALQTDVLWVHERFLQPLTSHGTNR